MKEWRSLFQSELSYNFQKSAKMEKTSLQKRQKLETVTVSQNTSFLKVASCDKV